MLRQLRGESLDEAEVVAPETVERGLARRYGRSPRDGGLALRLLHGVSDRAVTAWTLMTCAIASSRSATRLSSSADPSLVRVHVHTDDPGRSAFGRHGRGPACAGQGRQHSQAGGAVCRDARRDVRRDAGRNGRPRVYSAHLSTVAVVAGNGMAARLRGRRLHAHYLRRADHEPDARARSSRRSTPVRLRTWRCCPTTRTSSWPQKKPATSRRSACTSSVLAQCHRASPQCWRRAPAQTTSRRASGRWRRRCGSIRTIEVTRALSHRDDRRRSCGQG